ncbi:Uncharacterised protein [Mycobacteroides abscessus subsp. abscessus]|nr:Uncharacterised protein [Mycobacteroides abscessus subsp. abscessus]SKM69882.1 Uncharacterised protein [Mycobacteroides abscessus subsp. abscessus]SKN73013.1 Uncharacterised protein [Mycobacteroides abscessus subsp. abscessus]SKR46580.1 Uncharacterised protein [Mycobacteroides abscessus subsp. abscessus]SKR63025.1 Uncharacterised protein [Mycobacteroides abscessus subsp. abscessus]
MDGVASLDGLLLPDEQVKGIAYLHSAGVGATLTARPDNLGVLVGYDGCWTVLT